MNYKIEFTTKSLRIIKKIPQASSSLLHIELKKLADNPRLGEKRAGEVNTYRYRMGKYRIIYEIYDQKLVVLAVHFGHRKEVYRDL